MPDPAPKTVTVEAQPGRTVPLHRDDHSAGPDPFFLRGAGTPGREDETSGERCEVRWTTGIRRRIRSGDLAVVPVTAASSAAAPEIATAPIAAPATAPTK